MDLNQGFRDKINNFINYTGGRIAFAKYLINYAIAEGPTSLDSFFETWEDLPSPMKYKFTSYLNVNHDSPESCEFILWAVEFVEDNQDVTIEEFENWFMTKYDGPTEEAINSDLVSFDEPITQTSLPSFGSFVGAFPKNGTQGAYIQMPAAEVYTLVGGTLLTSYSSDPYTYGNACSIRGSRGLLYSTPAIHIPVLNYGNGQRTQKGADGKNYVLDAISFNKFMIAKFGDTPYKLEGADADNPEKVKELLKGKNGIYVIVNNSTGTAGYNGHVDAIINGKCISGSYTRPAGGVKSIRVWVLE